MAVANVPLNHGEIIVNETVVGPGLAAADTVSTRDNGNSAIAKAAAINAVAAKQG